jgi:hypothetical protein
MDGAAWPPASAVPAHLPTPAPIEEIPSIRSTMLPLDSSLEFLCSPYQRQDKRKARLRIPTLITHPQVSDRRDALRKNDALNLVDSIPRRFMDLTVTSYLDVPWANEVVLLRVSKQ